MWNAEQRLTARKTRERVMLEFQIDEDKKMQKVEITQHLKLE